MGEPIWSTVDQEAFGSGDRIAIWHKDCLTTFPMLVDRQQSIEATAPLPLAGSLPCGFQMGFRNLSEVDIH
jgi:hypothetical protein